MSQAEIREKELLSQGPKQQKRMCD